MPFLAIPSLVITFAVTAAVSVGLSLLSSLLFQRQQPQRQQPQQQQQPAAPNGTVNEKQPIPPLRVIAGRVRVGGDEAFLEERGGNLFQILVHAAHRIEGHVQHWLHDELATLDGLQNVSGPAHFDTNVQITTALGLDAETAWGLAVSTFPEIWTADHRGDGLAKAYLRCGAVSADRFSTVYPQGMPLLTSLVDGAWMFDPREPGHDPDDPDTWSFSRNLALIRLFHITHPAGCRLRIADLYLPEWQAAADLADEMVTNRDGAEEPRYWGGLSWKYIGDGQDAVSIGRKLDQAAELVPYVRGDGLIGVHGGTVGTPDLRFDDTDILAFRFDANQSQASTVLAVRGRFTDPRNQWNPGDAAIFGDPYSGSDDTQRTQTVDNEAVQSHNHIQRLQKLAKIRANAPRVSLTVAYDDAKADIMFRRFATVHHPPYCDEAIVELVNGTKLNLRSLTISFEAIVVPAGLYAFDAATEEGIPGGVVGAVEATGVPVPTGFSVAWLSDGAGPYGRAVWDHVDDTFTYELQYQLADATEPPHSIFSDPTMTVLRTPLLADTDHRFRLRTWSAGAPSGWTAWLAPGTGAGSDGDTTPTADPTGLTASYNGIDDRVHGSWTNPSDSNLHHTELYRAFGSTTFSDAVLIATDYSAPAAVATFADPEAAGGGLMHADYTYWIRSYNGSGVPSGLVGPVSVTVP